MSRRLERLKERARPLADQFRAEGFSELDALMLAACLLHSKPAEKLRGLADIVRVPEMAWKLLEVRLRVEAGEDRMAAADRYAQWYASRETGLLR